MDLTSGFFVGAGLMLSSVQHDFVSYRNWQDVSSKFVDSCGEYQVNGYVIQDFPKRGMSWDYRRDWIYSPDSYWYQRGGADRVRACTVYRRFNRQSEPLRLGERIHHAGKDVVSKSDRFDVVRGYRSDEFVSAYGQFGYWGNTGIVIGDGVSAASLVLGVVSDVSTDGRLDL